MNMAEAAQVRGESGQHGRVEIGQGTWQGLDRVEDAARPLKEFGASAQGARAERLAEVSVDRELLWNQYRPDPGGLLLAVDEQRRASEQVV